MHHQLPGLYTYFDQKAKERQAMRLINRLHTLGYQVHIEQKTA